MAPRPSRGDAGTPDQGVPGGGGASADKVLEIVQRLTTIESQLGFVVAAVDDSKAKIEAVAKDVTEARAKFDALKAVASAVSKGIWAIFALLLTFVLSIAGMWLKHHMGW